MSIFTIALLIGTAFMLVLHVMSWKVMQGWHAEGDNWTKRWLPSTRALRIEAAYWAVVLAAWPLWSPVAKIVIAVFGGIHLALWIGMEVKRQGHVMPDYGSSMRKVAVAIATFDFIECFALLMVGYSAALFYFHL